MGINFSSLRAIKGKIFLLHVFSVYSTLHCDTIVQCLYTIVCKQCLSYCKHLHVYKCVYCKHLHVYICVYCKHLHIYRCVYSNNNKGPLSYSTDCQGFVAVSEQTSSSGLFATINPWHCDITHDSAVRIENTLSALAENGWCNTISLQTLAQQGMSLSWDLHH